MYWIGLIAKCEGGSIEVIQSEKQRNKIFLKIKKILGWCDSIGWVSSCAPNGCWFDFHWGLGRRQLVIVPLWNHVTLSPSLFLSL